MMLIANKGAAGGRNRRLIKDNLKCSQGRMPGAVVLVDDVMTSGAHFRACAEFLRERGASVSIAVCAGRTVQEPIDHPLNLPPEDIEDIPSLEDFF